MEFDRHMKEQWDAFSPEAEDTLLGERIWNRLQRKVFFNKYSWHFAGIGAAFAMACVALVIYIGIGNKDYSAPATIQMVQILAQSSQQVLLPDGSTVFLDKGSELIYPEDMSKSRVVELNGNAVFDVRKTEDRKNFIVNTDASYIEVKGTSFAVNTEKGKEVSVILYSGAVDFVSTSNGQSVSLKPFNKLSFNVEDQSFNVNPSFSGIEWNNGSFIIRDANLNTISAFIEWRYNAEIEISPSIGRSQRLNGIIGYDESCEAVIEKFCYMLDLKSTCDNGRYRICAE